MGELLKRGIDRIEIHQCKVPTFRTVGTSVSIKHHGLLGLANNPNVFSAGTLRTLANFVLDLLADLQILESCVVETRHVEENIATITSDKTKTFFSKLLDGALSHLTFLTQLTGPKELLR